MKPFISPAISKIVPLLLFYKDGFGINYSTKVDMPLNKKKHQRKKKESTNIKIQANI